MRIAVVFEDEPDGSFSMRIEGSAGPDTPPSLAVAVAQLAAEMVEEWAEANGQTRSSLQ